jgi:hypothetical protein
MCLAAVADDKIHRFILVRLTGQSYLSASFPLGRTCPHPADQGRIESSRLFDKAGEPKPSIDMVADGLLALDKPSGRKKAASPNDGAAMHRVRHSTMPCHFRARQCDRSEALKTLAVHPKCRRMW